MKLSVYTAVLMAVLVDISSCQLDCAYPTGIDVERVISSVIRTGESPSIPTINVTSIHLVCLAHGHERDRYRLVSFLVQYACSGNPNCPFGIVLEQFESECDNGEWGNAVLAGTDHTRTTDPVANMSTSPREDCAFCLSPDLASSSGLLTDSLTHCIGKVASPFS